MTSSRTLSAGAIGGLLAFAMLAAHPDAFALRALETLHASGINYDSRTSVSRPYEAKGTADASVSALEIDPETGLIRDLKGRDLHIAMTFEARDLRFYPNLFQTAPGNSGLRLEFTQETAAIIAATNEPGGVEAIFVSTDCKPNVPHTFDLLVDRHDRVVVTLDGVVRIDALRPELAYQISDVVIGSGFSIERPFIGRITGASVRYGIYKIDPNAASLRIDCIGFSLTLSAICGYFLIGPERRSQLRWKRLFAPWQARATTALVRKAHVTTNDAAARRYVWALPDDGAAELSIDRRAMSFRALDFLAEQLDRDASSAHRDITAREAPVEYSLELPGGGEATLRLSSSRNIADASLRRLARYVRELAEYVEP